MAKAITTTLKTVPVTVAPVEPKKEEQAWLSTGMSTVSRTVSDLTAKATKFVKEHKQAIGYTAVGAAALGGMYAAHSYLNATPDPQPGSTEGWSDSATSALICTGAIFGAAIITAIATRCQSLTKDWTFFRNAPDYLN